jgi:hypothetical protein
MRKRTPTNRFDALVYRDGKRRGGIVRRQYELWRSEQDPPLPLRCDNVECRFYSESLVWHGRKLKAILDHQNGNNTDNRPSNLRFLCPNCDSQQVETSGGANRGRIEKASGGFAIVSKTGARNYVLPVEPGQFVLEGRDVDLRVEKAQQAVQPDHARKRALRVNGGVSRPRGTCTDCPIPRSSPSSTDT